MAKDDRTVIDRSSFVCGRIEGSGDLEIAGRVEGDVAVSGEVLIAETGLVGANVSAARIVVRGAVKGDLVAEESLHVDASARVVGDLRAPRIAIAPGGLVRGHVQTGGARSGERPRAATSATSAARAETKPRVTAREPVSAAPRAVAAPAPPPPPAKAAATKEDASSANNRAPRGAALAGARVGPPAPVVPVLKKGTKAIAVHKKTR